MRGISRLHVENAERHSRLGVSQAAVVIAVASRESDGRGGFQGVGQPTRADSSATVHERAQLGHHARDIEETTINNEEACRATHSD